MPGSPSAADELSLLEEDRPVADFLEKLPPEVQQAVCRVTAQHSVYSGPLPPPEVLAGYDKVLPGAAERILSLAEGEAGHRREMERKIASQEGSERMFGLLLAFVVALTGIGGAIWCILSGYQVAGTILSSGTIGSLVWAFISGSRMRSDFEVEQKKGLMEKKE